MQKQLRGLSTSALDQALGETESGKTSDVFQVGRLQPEEKKNALRKKKIQSWVSWIFWLSVKHHGSGPSSSIDSAAEWRLSPDSCISLISWGWCSTAKALAHQAHNACSHTKCSPSRKAHGFLPFWANYLLFQWNLLALSSSLLGFSIHVIL